MIHAQIPYGTPAMAAAVGGLVNRGTDHAILAMGGHEDGIVAYGASLDETAVHLMRWLVRSVQLSAAESQPEQNGCL